MNANALMETFPNSEEFLKGINKYYEEKLLFQLPQNSPLQKLMKDVFDKVEAEMTNEAIDSLKELEKLYMVDNVNNPPHYQSKNGLEVIDIIHDFDLNFNLGNAIKYILRHAKKGGTEDIKKAVWYLNYEIESRENEGNEQECLPF